MKKLLVVIFILITNFIYGQGLNLRQPKTELEKAKSDYKIALKEKDSPLLINSLLLQLAYQKNINMDSIPVILNQIEEYIEDAEKIDERSILHGIMAQMYVRFEHNNSSSGSPIVGYVPKNMKEWTGNIFMEKIFYHAWKAIENKEILLTTSKYEYEALLYMDKLTSSLNQSLYDILVNMSISALNEYLFNKEKQMIPQKGLDERYMVAADDFVNMNIDVSANQYKTGIARMYQLLLQNAIESGNDNARIVYDLERLIFINERNVYEDIMVKRLEELISNYSNSPYIVEVIYKLAKIYINKSAVCERESPEQAVDYLVKAIEICESGMERFSDYFRINNLEFTLDNIREAKLSCEHQQNVYPGKDLELKIVYKNLREVNLSIYRIHSDVITCANKKFNPERTRILTERFTLKESLINKDTVLKIPIGDVGLYEVVVEDAKEKYGDQRYFSSSRILGISRQVSKDGYEFLVCDYASGAPIEDAEVILYTENFGTLGSAKTDSNGIAEIKTNEKYARRFLVRYKDDRNNLQTFNSYYYSDNRNESLSFYTDRSIYRPGQTVHLKGIAKEKAGERTILSVGKEFSVSLFGRNGQEIAKKVFITNEYGSFTGDFKLPEEGLSGGYYFRCGRDSHHFTVSEYKRPKFEIIFDKLESDYRLGDKLEISGYAKSYSGASMSGSKVSYSLFFNDYSLNNKPIKVGQTTTDKYGNFSLTLDTKEFWLDEDIKSQRYKINFTITTPNGETHKKERYIQVSDKGYKIYLSTYNFYDKDKNNSFEVQTVNYDDVRLERKLNYTISKLKSLERIDDKYDINNLPIEKSVLQGCVQTKKEGKNERISHSFSKWKSGAYVIEIEGEDKGEIITSKEIFYLFSRKDKTPPLLTGLLFINSKSEIEVGENAEILLGTSIKDANILLEISVKETPIERRKIKLSNQMTLLKIPYLESYGGNFNVNVSLVKDGNLYSKSMGITRKSNDTNLKIITKTFRDKLKPGEEEEWSLIIEDPHGKRKIAELMVAMYDASLEEIRWRNHWGFNSQIGYYNHLARWGLLKYKTKNSFIFPRKEYSYNYFKYDKFNLYNLGHYHYLLMPFGINEFGPTYSLHTSYSSALQDNEIKKIDIADESRVEKEPEEENSENISVRENFKETAFFYPQLVTDNDGQVTFKFKVPDATTKWRFMALAHTKELEHGFMERIVITQKELMVQTNMPRFVRANDNISLQALINNLTDETLKGKVYLELFNPKTEIIFQRIDNDFEVSGGENTTVNFSFSIPEDKELLGCRIVASSPTHSDGEQHLLPIIPDKVLLTKTQSIFTNQKGEQSYKFTIPESAKILKFSLEFTSNPVWNAIMAIPTVNRAKTENITNITGNFYVSSVARLLASANPAITKTIKEWANSKGDENLKSQLEKNQELKNIILELTPWVNDAENETERISLLSELLDENRQKYLYNHWLEKIKNMQNPDGGWGWFKGCNSGLFMTFNVLEAMSRLTSLGVIHDKSVLYIQNKALNYADSLILHDEIFHYNLLYLYIRSSYRDITNMKVAEVRQKALNHLEQVWEHLDLYEKALAALIFHRDGKTYLAKEVIETLREYSTTTKDMGMFWANNRSGFYRNSAIQIHVAIMNAFKEIDYVENEMDNMRQWLLRQKQTQDWGGVPSTVDAIHAIISTGTNYIDNSESLAIILNHKDISSEIGDDVFGYIKHSIDGNNLENKKDIEVNINKNTENPTWGGFYLQYFDELENITTNSSGFSVKKELYLLKEENNGVYQEPISGNNLKMGDRVNVRIIVEADQDMEYVYLKDLRAGCFEPTKQLPGNEYKKNVYYYKEITDVAANFFIEYLPKGVHIFEYDVWVNQSGMYQDGISTVQCIYAPEFSANSESIKVHVDN